MDLSLPASTTEPAPADGARPEMPPQRCASAQPQRLAHLFRRSLGRGEVHPLLHVLKCHHGVDEGLTIPQVRPVQPRATAPQAAVCVDKLRQRVATLPSLPKAVQDAMAVLNDEGASIGDVTERIERDQVLTARTLRAANTAFYGAPGRVATIRTAIGILGLRAVAALLTTASVSSQFSASNHCAELRFGDFWRHALSTALVARGLAARLGLDGEVAFTAGLLHDIGALMLATQFPAETGVALRFAREHDLPMLAIERTVLGVDHCVAGEALARHWRFPDATVHAIASHHDLPANPDGKPVLAELVHIADALAHGIQPAGGLDDAVPPVAVATWARLGVGTPACLAILQSAASNVEALCEALAL